MGGADLVQDSLRFAQLAVDKELAVAFGKRGVIGIDPGASGGIAWLSHDRQTSITCKMPETERDTFDSLESFKEKTDEIVIEFVTPMPFDQTGARRQGIGSTWKFGMHYGMLRGFLIALKIPFRQVRAHAWQKALAIPQRGTKSQTEHKNALKAAAQQLFPQIKVTHALADALLIAEFARRAYSPTKHGG